MRFLDLFAGIGGFRLGMEQAGHECVGYVEWDKYARKSYEAIHDTEGEWTAHDITKVTDDEINSLRERNIDVICGGFPCQSFSVAGRRMGFEDIRGTMFFEIARFAKQIKPQYLLLENVKGLLNHSEGATFGTILRTLDELGYDVEWQVLNTKNFSTEERPTPQNRERVFIVGHHREREYKPIFPITQTANGVLKVIQADTSGKGLKSQQDRFYMIDGIMCTLPNARAKTKCCVVDENGNFMILTAKERMRLQGFPDNLIDKALKVTSEDELSKQAGNSVTVNVIHEIAKRL
jgi:DNA (cytosine-5)-methyltransferase 1